MPTIQSRSKKPDSKTKTKKAATAALTRDVDVVMEIAIDSPAQPFASAECMERLTDEQLKSAATMAAASAAEASRQAKLVAAEQARRLAAAKTERNRVIWENRAGLLALLTHDRTSCSDDNPSNGYAHYPDGSARCTKCALMTLEEYQLENVEIAFDLRISNL